MTTITIEVLALVRPVTCDACGETWVPDLGSWGRIDHGQRGTIRCGHCGEIIVAEVCVVPMQAEGVEP